MSLLQSIKGTFKTVQEDISEGIKSLTISSDKPKDLEVSPVQIPTGPLINYDAGGQVLQKYELIWKDLYQYTETTALKAQEVDTQLRDVYIKCDKQTELFLKLHDEACRLPQLLNQIHNITNVLAQVEEQYDKVEASLVDLENICEMLEFEHNVASHNKQLAVYKMKQEHELQAYRVQLAKNHAHKVEETNKRRLLLLKERHTAFEEQFTMEMEYYKKHGKPERLPSTSEGEQKLDIADVEIEADPDALDAFLASSTSDLQLADVKDQSDSDDTSETTLPAIEVDSEILCDEYKSVTASSLNESEAHSNNRIKLAGDSIAESLSELQTKLAGDKAESSSDSQTKLASDSKAESSSNIQTKLTSDSQVKSSEFQTKAAHDSKAESSSYSQTKLASDIQSNINFDSPEEIPSSTITDKQKECVAQGNFDCESGSSDEHNE